MQILFTTLTGEFFSSLARQQGWVVGENLVGIDSRALSTRFRIG